LTRSEYTTTTTIIIIIIIIIIILQPVAIERADARMPLEHFFTSQ
jgi:hypothetical protein